VIVIAVTSPFFAPGLKKCAPESRAKPQSHLYQPAVIIQIAPSGRLSVFSLSARSSAD